MKMKYESWLKLMSIFLHFLGEVMWDWPQSEPLSANLFKECIKKCKLKGLEHGDSEKVKIDNQTDFEFIL